MEPTRDERNMAALAQGLGLVAAAPVWLRWRNQSAFVRAHAVQSILFDGMTITALVGVGVIAIGIAVGGNAALASTPGQNDIARLFVLAVCAPGVALIGCLAVVIAALILRLRATMAANQGQPFRYPLIKQILEIARRQATKV
jgi:uncharacterized membrane protein